ncbi:hypothetical protein [Microbacterium maritypicum]
MNTQTITQTDALTARAAISTIIEPGDGVAGTLVDALGPVAAFEAITGNRPQAALQDAGVGERTAQDSIPLTSASSSGCHRLIGENGATLITNAQDVLALLESE